MEKKKKLESISPLSILVSECNIDVVVWILGYINLIINSQCWLNCELLSDILCLFSSLSVIILLRIIFIFIFNASKCQLKWPFPSCVCLWYNVK